MQVLSLYVCSKSLYDYGEFSYKIIFFYLSRRFQGEINMALNGVKMTSGSGDPSKVNSKVYLIDVQSLVELSSVSASWPKIAAKLLG